MHKLITESYWLMFDYVKPCLHSVPRIEEQTLDWHISADINLPWNENDTEITFTKIYTPASIANAEADRKLSEYKIMLRFIYGLDWALPGVTDIFRSRRTHAEYEVFLTVLKNMILAGKITKDDCVKMLSEAENHETLVELLQFDAGEEQDRFKI